MCGSVKIYNDTKTYQVEYCVAMCLISNFEYKLKLYITLWIIVSKYIDEHIMNMLQICADSLIFRI